MTRDLTSTAVLFRPVGEKELRLIAESGYKAFPSRLPGQPIFYPVLNEEYARQIARDWNATAVAPHCSVGLVQVFFKSIQLVLECAQLGLLRS
jgi:hypothetical protein